MSAWRLRLVPPSWRTEPIGPECKRALTWTPVILTREQHAEMEPEAGE